MDASGDVPVAVVIAPENNTMGYGADIPRLRKNRQYAAPYEAYCSIPDLVAPGAVETLSPVLSFLTTMDLMWQGVQITMVPVTGQTSRADVFGTNDMSSTLR